MTPFKIQCECNKADEGCRLCDSYYYERAHSASGVKNVYFRFIPRWLPISSHCSAASLPGSLLVERTIEESCDLLGVGRFEGG